MEVHACRVGGQDVVGEVLYEPDRPAQEHLHGGLRDAARAIVPASAAGSGQEVLGVFAGFQGGASGSLMTAGSVSR